MKFENNFLNIENGVTITKYSSCMEGCGVENILHSDNKTIWLSEEGLPQFFILNLTNLKKRPEHYALFGIYCWHAYPTNPKLIELQYSKDMLNYNTLAKFDILQKPGIQIFNFDKIKSENVKLLKIVIKESHGGSRTYLNNVFLLDDMQIEESDSMIVLDSRESNMPRKSEISTERKEKIKDEKELDTNFNTKLNTIENISKEKIINSYNPLVISDIQTNLSINKNETKNPLFISETNYLISDSDLSIRGEKLNMSHMSDLNKRNPIREALSDEENEEDIYEYQTHIQKPSYTGTNLSKINSSRENLEDKLMKGLNIRQEHVLDLNPSSENTEITGNPGNTRNKKETDFKAGNNLNILENYKNKIKRLNQNYSLDSNLVEMSLTNNNHNNRRSLEIKKEESSNFSPTYNKLQNSQYSKSKDNFNYKSLESQLREMQCELNKLNYNTERLDSFRDLINKSKEDLFLKEENVKNDFENIEKINFISPPMSPSNIIKSEVKNNRQVEENPFDNYLVHNDSPLLDTKVTNLQNDVDSLKSQISKISENIDTLVSTKNLMTANNMQFILDQCRNMIHSPKIQMKTGDEDRYNFVNHGGLPLYPNGCTIPHSCCNNSHHAISSQNLSSGLHNRNFSSVPQVEYYNENLNKENSKIQITSDGNRKRLKFEKNINKKIDKKFDDLEKRLELRIYNSILKPTVEKLENSLKGNLNELKIYLQSVKIEVNNDGKQLISQKTKINKKKIQTNSEVKKKNFNLSINTINTLNTID